MAFPTTETETVLSSVNSILAAIGQSPITTLDYTNPEISFIKELLDEADTDVQNEGWVFNREEHYRLTPSRNDGRISELNDNDTIFVIPNNILRMDVSEGQVWRTTDVVKRNGCLYDKVRHTYKFEKPIDFDIVWKFPYEDLPSAFKRYITYRAAVRAATQQVGNPQLAAQLAQQEAYMRAVCMEYECNQGDFSMFGTPTNTHYQPYQPYQTLNRLA